jgi:hypothetical protein
MARVNLVSLCCLFSPAALAQEAQTSSLAEAFASYPALWDVRLSPDGTKTAQIRLREDGTTIATVLDVAQGTQAVVLVGQAGEAVIEACGWTSASRVLCSVSAPATVERSGRRNAQPTQTPAALQTPPPVYDPNELAERLASAVPGSRGRPAPLPRVTVSAITVLTAVESDGSEPKALAQLPGQSTTLPVIDWLPDDPVHVRVQPKTLWGPAGTLDVYTGELTLDSDAYVRDSISDGNGIARVYREQVAMAVEAWFARDTPTSEWTKLHERNVAEEVIGFSPLGFAAGSDELLYLDRHDVGWRPAGLGSRIANRW